MRDIKSLTSRLKMFSVDLSAAPNLTNLRQGARQVIATAQDLESRIIDVRLSSKA